MNQSSLQEQFSPNGICFGCGPANPQGLHLRSYAQGEELKAVFKPQPHHQAFPGVLNGGIIGALLDCHSNWTACWHLMRKKGLGEPPCTVTADFKVELKRPAPVDQDLELLARVIESGEERAVVQASLGGQGKVYALCTGTFVAVKPGHPAYNAWK